MVKRITFQERINVVKYAAMHGSSGAARQFWHYRNASGFLNGI
ncbi:hypothetical protein [Mesosutterella porci]|nr:hypothetical protein [Mesosutterella sp. oilRF-744-WT-GAM-9]